MADTERKHLACRYYMKGTELITLFNGGTAEFGARLGSRSTRCVLCNSLDILHFKSCRRLSLDTVSHRVIGKAKHVLFFRTKQRWRLV